MIIYVPNVCDSIILNNKCSQKLCCVTIKIEIIVMPVTISFFLTNVFVISYYLVIHVHEESCPVPEIDRCTNIVQLQVITIEYITIMQ